MQFTLQNARLVDATMDSATSDITIDGAYIQRVGHVNETEENVIDASNTIITPGFIDVHTHGGGGFIVSMPCLLCSIANLVLLRQLRKLVKCKDRPWATDPSQHNQRSIGQKTQVPIIAFYEKVCL